jgi:hypothetical protein
MKRKTRQGKSSHAHCVFLYESMWTPEPSWLIQATMISPDITVRCRSVAIQVNFYFDAGRVKGYRSTSPCGLEPWEQVHRTCHMSEPCYSVYPYVEHSARYSHRFTIQILVPRILKCLRFIAGSQLGLSRC